MRTSSPARGPAICSACSPIHPAPESGRRFSEQRRAVKERFQHLVHNPDYGRTAFVPCIEMPVPKHGQQFDGSRSRFGVVCALNYEPAKPPQIAWRPGGKVQGIGEEVIQLALLEPLVNQFPESVRHPPGKNPSRAHRTGPRRNRSRRAVRICPCTQEFYFRCGRNPP